MIKLSGGGKIPLSRDGKIPALAPLAAVFFLLLILFLIGVRYRNGGGSIVENLIKEGELLSEMRVNVLKAIDAEKSAVLAETEDASKKFADASRQASDMVDKGLQEISPIIERDRMEKEKALLTEFVQSWTELKKLDDMILDLAVQGTNVKAMRLSSTRGAEDMKRFEEALTKLTGVNPPNNECDRMARPAFRALAFGNKILYLHTQHIAAALDAQMDAIERTIRSDSDVVKSSLKSLASLANGEGAALKEAETAYDDFTKVTAEVIELSRKNTNIKSLELSLGKKRIVAARCEEILNALQDAVKNRTFKATR